MLHLDLRQKKYQTKKAFSIVVIRKFAIFNENFGYLIGLLAGGKTPDVSSRTYTQIMREQMLAGEETEVFILFFNSFLSTN